MPQLAPMAKRASAAALPDAGSACSTRSQPKQRPCPFSLSSKGQPLFSAGAQLPQLRAKRDGTGPLFDKLQPCKHPCSKRRYTTICIAVPLLYKQNPFFAFFCRSFAWSAFLLPLLWCSQSLCALRQTFCAAAALKCRFAAAKYLCCIAKYLRCGNP